MTSALKRTRKILLSAALTLLIQLLPSAAALADAPYRIIVPFPPGGAVDRIARSLAAELSMQPEFQVVVENRPGGDGLIAIEQSLQQGRVSLLMVNPYFTTAMANGRLPPVKASRFKALMHVGDVEILLVSGKRSSLQTLSDLTGGSAPEKPFGCAAASGQFTTICDRLARDFPRAITSIPYKGEAQALADLLGGHIDLMPITRISAEPHLKSEAINLLASLARPVAAASDAAASFVLRTPIMSFMGIVVTDEMPEAQAMRLQRELEKVLGLPRFQSAATAMGIRVAGGSAANFDRFLRENVATQSRLLQGQP
jgi:tripartite-type tricarboxylate transporter receptor subunit TctC